MKIKSVKMTKQHIFIIENNLQKVGESFFHLFRRTTVIQDLLIWRQFSLVPDNLTKVNVEAWRCRKIWQYIKLFSTTILIKKNQYGNLFHKPNHSQCVYMYMHACAFSMNTASTIFLKGNEVKIMKHSYLGNWQTFWCMVVI